MARVTNTITVRKDKETGFWSYRVEQHIEGIYAGIVSWGNSRETSYSAFRRKAMHFLPALKVMTRDGNTWSLVM